jgi:DNA-binding MarR family transcriptional regulator
MDMRKSQKARRTRTSSLGWMIQRIAGKLDRAMEARLSAHDLTVAQFAVVMTVLEHEGLSQTEIGERFGMPAYAISRAIDHLENTGLVVREPHPTSRRTHVIHATDAAYDLSASLFDIIRDVNAELATPLTTAERSEFLRLLKKLL